MVAEEAFGGRGELSESAKEWLDRVDYCIEHGAECNDWEDDFLESVREWIKGDNEPTLKQQETIEKIEYLVEWGRDLYWEEYGYGG